MNETHYWILVLKNKPAMIGCCGQKQTTEKMLYISKLYNTKLIADGVTLDSDEDMRYREDIASSSILNELCLYDTNKLINDGFYSTN